MNLLCCILGTWGARFAQAEGWPQFRGPSGQGTVSNSLLPRVWDETTGLVWKTAIPGLGHSSPVHDGKSIWLTSATVDGSVLLAIKLDAETGLITDEITIFTPENIDRIHHDNSYASPTPVLEGGRLYVHFGTYGTACIDSDSTQVLWRNTDYPVSHEGGPGSSPILYEDLLIITLDGANSQRVVALDKETGTHRWTRERSGPFPKSPTERRAFSTPLIFTHQGRTMLLSPGAQQCHAYDPSTGEELWSITYVGFSNVPRPVYNGTFCFLCTGFYSPELWAIDPSGSGNVTQTHLKWKFKGAVPETPSPVQVENSIYLISNNGILTVLNAETGKRERAMRVGGNYSASPLAAKGLVYLCNEAGTVKVIDTQSGKPRVIESNDLNSRIMASPAVLENDLLIRTEDKLYRIRGQKDSSD